MTKRNSLKKYNLINDPFNFLKKAKIISNKKTAFSNVQKNYNKDNIQKKKNNYSENKIIDKINKIPGLICCRTSVDKIEDLVVRVYFKNDKINSKINVVNSYSGTILKCKILNKIYDFSFELHISNFKDYKNYILIRPSLIKGNNSLFFELFENLKNELLY